MDPQQLPLEPLIAPPPVSWWPLAPLWWIAIALLVFIMLTIVSYQFRKKLRRNRPAMPIFDIDLRREAALKELDSLEKPYNQPAGAWLQQLNILLKRLCIARYPNENINVLIGQHWLDYLDHKSPLAQIKNFPLLVDMEYHPNYYLDTQTIDNLHSSIKKWITHYV